MTILTPHSPSAKIRTATSADLPALGRLGSLLVRSHHEFDPARFFAATAETEQGYAWFLGTQIDNADSVVLVAEEENGQVVGYAFSQMEGRDYMSLRGPAGVLHDLVVDPDYRGRGIGRMLLNASMEALQARGAPSFVLFTAQGNEAAQRLFASVGFRRTMVEMTLEATQAADDDRAPKN